MHAIRYFETKDVNKASGGFEREKGKEEEECPKLVHRETLPIFLIHCKIHILEENELNT